MTRPTALAVAVCSLAFGPIAPRGAAAPAPADRPAHFEYAEVTLTRSMTPPARQPGAAPAPWVEHVKAAWTTADEVVEADGWENLAAKLKAPEAKKELSDVQQRLRVFNRLGADGWEVYDRSTGNRGVGNVTIWALKRRLP